MVVIRANKIDSLQAIDTIIIDLAGIIAVIKKEADDAYSDSYSRCHEINYLGFYRFIAARSNSPNLLSLTSTAETFLRFM
ncbi:MAG: hypothetical protein AAGF98_12040, partial [Cyanobacteria bacterium P01_H01_bin.153]